MLGRPGKRKGAPPEKWIRCERLEFGGLMAGSVGRFDTPLPCSGGLHHLYRGRCVLICFGCELEAEHFGAAGRLGPPECGADADAACAERRVHGALAGCVLVSGEPKDSSAGLMLTCRLTRASTRRRRG